MDAAGETFPINSGNERPELQVVRLDLEHSDALPMARFWHDSRALKVRASRQFSWRLRSCDRPWRPGARVLALGAEATKYMFRGFHYVRE